MDKSTGRLKAVAAYAKSVGIAADQLINAVLGGRLKPCPSAPTASACWMAGQVGGASFGSSTHCFGGRKTIAGARMPPPSTDAHTKIKTLPTYGRAESTNDKTAARRCCPHRVPRQPQQRQPASAFFTVPCRGGGFYHLKSMGCLSNQSKADSGAKPPKRGIYRE